MTNLAKPKPNIPYMYLGLTILGFIAGVIVTASIGNFNSKYTLKIQSPIVFQAPMVVQKRLLVSPQATSSATPQPSPTGSPTPPGVAPSKE